MGRASSPLRGELVFLVGARRSGTNWLQRTLVAHPDIVAVPSETSLFSHGIAQLRERFQHAALSSPRTGAVYMDRDTMRDALRDFCDAVFIGLKDAIGPRAQRLVERTPDHVRHLDLIGEIYPDAYVVHIIRDGRDVARSLISQPWGPDTIAEAAQEWRSSIQAARAACPQLERYVEVRYEELLASPKTRIAALYEWLGVDASAEIVARALDEAGVKFNVDPEHAVVASGKWRDTFTDADADTFNEVAGDMLAKLGYDVARTDVAQPRPPAPEPARAGIGSKLKLRRGRSARETRVRVRAALALVEGFLGALTARRIDMIETYLSPNAYVRVVGDGTDHAARGAPGLDLLREAVRADDALGGRQLAGDIHPGLPTFVFVATFEHEGTRADRVVVLGVEGSSIVRCIYYRLS